MLSLQKCWKYLVNFVQILSRMWHWIHRRIRIFARRRRKREEWGTVTLRVFAREKSCARISLTHLPSLFLSLLTSILICQMTFSFVSKHARDSSLFILNLVVVLQWMQTFIAQPGRYRMARNIQRLANRIWPPNGAVLIYRLQDYTLVRVPQIC